MERAATSLPSIDICAQGNDRRWPAGGMQHNLLDGGFEQIEAHEYLGSRRSRSHGFTVRPAGKATNHRRAKAEYSIKYKQQNDSHYKKANTR
jgi:hypothetical protein